MTKAGKYIISDNDPNWSIEKINDGMFTYMSKKQDIVKTYINHLPDAIDSDNYSVMDALYDIEKRYHKYPYDISDKKSMYIDKNGAKWGVENYTTV